MNLPFLSKLFPRAHTRVRFVASTKAEDAAALAKRMEVRLQLGVYAAVTPHDQILADNERIKRMSSDELAAVCGLRKAVGR